jgi:hypothetical protein
LQAIAKEPVVADARQLYIVSRLWSGNDCVQQAETKVITSTFRCQRHQLMVSSYIALIARH